MKQKEQSNVQRQTKVTKGAKGTIETKKNFLMNPLERIINTLLLNASFIDNIGLMNGKMGIAISFYHLARKTGNTVYEDYAGELIDEIHEEISVNTACDFENGLAGIGWGIEYLVQNGFIEADTDEVLEDFDKRMFRHLIYNTPTEVGLKNGLVGIGAYFLARIKNPQSNDNNIKTLTNKHLLIHVVDEIDEFMRKNGSDTLHQTINNNQEYDLTNDLFVLLLFLSEVHSKDVFNFKVNRIITFLLDSVSKNEIFSNPNKLMICLILEKMKNKISEPSICRIIDNISIKYSILSDRETLLENFDSNDFSLCCGKSGIAWIYKELFNLTKREEFLTEFNYWRLWGIEKENLEIRLANINNQKNGFGLVDGIAVELLLT